MKKLKLGNLKFTNAVYTINNYGSPKLRLNQRLIVISSCIVIYIQIIIPNASLPKLTIGITAINLFLSGTQFMHDLSNSRKIIYHLFNSMISGLLICQQIYPILVNVLGNHLEPYLIWNIGLIMVALITMVAIAITLKVAKRRHHLL